ncbi:MAG: PAS domain-containing protein [Roseinatronobacter sp.]
MTDVTFPAQTAAPADAGPVDLVCRHWATLPRRGLAPNRSDLDPQAISAALPYVFIAELVTKRVARLRLVGHALEDLLDMDMRGMPLSALFTTDARPVLATAFEQVERGARVLLPLRAERGWGLPEMTGQLALLPLCDGHGEITRILGVLERKGDAGRAPRRFTISAPAPISLSMPENTLKTSCRQPSLRVIIGGKR